MAILIDALHDKNDRVRLTAVEALGKIGDAAAVAALTDALRDNNTWVRRTAAEALGKIGDAAALSALLGVLADKDPEMWRTAVEALGKIGDAAAVAALIDALGDVDFRVCEAAAWALAEMGDAAAVSPLLAVLGDEDSEVRRTAAKVLGKLGDAQLLAELATDFRQGAQTNQEVIDAITSLQERFKVYRTDTFWSTASETRLTGEKAMQPKTLRVILASPGDVQPERDVLPEVIDELNRYLARDRNLHLELYRWETDAYPGFHSEGPQGLIDRILKIEDCDILIGIFWKHFGTPTKDADSGTEHEFRTAYEAWKQNKRPQIMVYFKRAPYSPSSPEELDQWRKVLEFQKAFPKEGLWWPFKTTNKFRDLVRQHLSGWLRDNFKA